MPTPPTRTYSFRAAATLGERLTRADQLLGGTAPSPVPEAEFQRAVVRELEIGLARRRRDGTPADMSASLRSIVELFADAVEKVADDFGSDAAYRAWLAEDPAASAIGDVGLELAVEALRDRP